MKPLYLISYIAIFLCSCNFASKKNDKIEKVEVLNLDGIANTYYNNKLTNFLKTKEVISNIKNCDTANLFIVPYTKCSLCIESVLSNLNEKFNFNLIKSVLFVIEDKDSILSLNIIKKNKNIKIVEISSQYLKKDINFSEVMLITYSRKFKSKISVVE